MHLHGQPRTGQIFFMTVDLEKQVHVTPLGFTHAIPVYGWGRDADEAQRHVRAFYEGGGLAVKDFLGSAIPAVNQELGRYTFPEQISGLPEEIALEAIQASKLPEEWIEDSIQTYRKRQRQILASNQLNPAR